MSCIVSFLEFGEDIVKSLLACLLLKSLLGHVISLLVEFLVHLLAKFLVVDLMVILALHVLAKFLRQLYLHLAHGLDGVHGGLESTNHVLLAHFLHLAFHHHDVVG